MVLNESVTNTSKRNKYLLALACVATVVAVAVVWERGSDWFWRFAPQTIATFALMITGLLDYTKAADKRTNRHKRLRLFFFGLVATLLVLNVWKTVRDDRATTARVAQAAQKERRLVLNLLNGIAHEVGWNYGVIQRKQGLAWEPNNLDREIFFLKADIFQKKVPQFFSSSLSLLEDFGAIGEQAHRDIMVIYGAIDDTEKSEALFIDMAEKAKTARDKREAIKGLYGFYADLRKDFETKGTAIGALRNQLQQEEDRYAGP